MSTYLTHLAVDAKTLPASTEFGYEEIAVSPGTYLQPSETEEQAREHFRELDELLEPNAELRIYRMDDEDYDINEIQQLLDDDVVLDSTHGAEVIEYRAFAGVPRQSPGDLSEALDATFEEVDEKTAEQALAAMAAQG